jgi:hypothetical protein
MWWQLILLAPFVVLVLLVAVPLLVAYGVISWSRGLRLQSRVKRRWPEGKFVLFSYTNNPKWAPFILDRIVPRIGDACVLVNRSNAQWREQFPLEARAIEHWGGYREHNPLAVVFPRDGRPRVFRMYKAFQQLHRGKPQQIEEVTKQLIETVDECRRNQDLARRGVQR